MLLLVSTHKRDCNVGAVSEQSHEAVVNLTARVSDGERTEAGKCNFRAR